MTGAFVERCATGIPGFDRACEGGFVRNSSNVIIGGPGSGKTTFLLQFLWNGATMYNENGLYCSFEPDVIETLKDAQVHGWDFAKLNEQDRVKFLKFSPKTTVEQLKSQLTEVISKYEIKRICFDPISVLAIHLNDLGTIRETIFELIGLMKRLKVTSILVEEAAEEHRFTRELTSWRKTDIIKFLSDSVITFYEQGIADIEERSMRINKMRRTDHERDILKMKLSSKGVEFGTPVVE